VTANYHALLRFVHDMITMEKIRSAHTTVFRVTTGMENLKMSGILTAVREMSGILLKVTEVLGKKSCQGKVA